MAEISLTRAENEVKKMTQEELDVAVNNAKTLLEKAGYEVTTKKPPLEVSFDYTEAELEDYISAYMDHFALYDSDGNLCDRLQNAKVVVDIVEELGSDLATKERISLGATKAFAAIFESEFEGAQAFLSLARMACNLAEKQTRMGAIKEMLNETISQMENAARLLVIGGSHLNLIYRVYSDEEALVECAKGEENK